MLANAPHGTQAVFWRLDGMGAAWQGAKCEGKLSDTIVHRWERKPLPLDLIADVHAAGSG